MQEDFQDEARMGGNIVCKFSLPEAFAMFGFPDGTFEGQAVTWEVIKSTGQRLAMLYHPDNNNGDERNFKDLQAARDVLEACFEKQRKCASVTTQQAPSSPQTKNARKNKATEPLETDPRNDRQYRKKAKELWEPANEGEICKLVLANNAIKLQAELDIIVLNRGLPKYKVNPFLERIFSLAAKHSEEDVLKTILKAQITYAFRRATKEALKLEELERGAKAAVKLYRAYVPLMNIDLCLSLHAYIEEVKKTALAEKNAWGQNQAPSEPIPTSAQQSAPRKNPGAVSFSPFSSWSSSNPPQYQNAGASSAPWWLPAAEVFPVGQWYWSNPLATGKDGTEGDREEKKGDLGSTASILRDFGRSESSPQNLSSKPGKLPKSPVSQTVPQPSSQPSMPQPPRQTDALELEKLRSSLALGFHSQNVGATGRSPGR